MNSFLLHAFSVVIHLIPKLDLKAFRHDRRSKILELFGAVLDGKPGVEPLFAYAAKVHSIYPLKSHQRTARKKLPNRSNA